MKRALESLPSGFASNLKKRNFISAVVNSRLQRVLVPPVFQATKPPNLASSSASRMPHCTKKSIWGAIESKSTHCSSLRCVEEYSPNGTNAKPISSGHCQSERAFQL